MAVGTRESRGGLCSVRLPGSKRPAIVGDKDAVAGNPGGVIAARPRHHETNRTECRQRGDGTARCNRIDNRVPIGARGCRFDVAGVVRGNAVKAKRVSIDAGIARRGLYGVRLPGRECATVVGDKNAVAGDPGSVIGARPRHGETSGAERRKNANGTARRNHIDHGARIGVRGCRFDVADVVGREAVEAISVTIDAREARGGLRCIGLPGGVSTTVIRNEHVVRSDARTTGIILSGPANVECSGTEIRQSVHAARRGDGIDSGVKLDVGEGELRRTRHRRRHIELQLRRLAGEITDPEIERNFTQEGRPCEVDGADDLIVESYFQRVVVAWIHDLKVQMQHSGVCGDTDIHFRIHGALCNEACLPNVARLVKDRVEAI